MTDLKPFINHVADEADDLLGETSTVEQAREELREHVSQLYPKLSTAERAAVVTGVINILKEEDFFSGARDENGYGDDDASDGFGEEE